MGAREYGPYEIGEGVRILFQAWRDAFVKSCKLKISFIFLNNHSGCCAVWNQRINLEALALLQTKTKQTKRGQLILGWQWWRQKVDGVEDKINRMC